MLAVFERLEGRENPLFPKEEYAFSLRQARPE
jgi:hypothetical protein